MTRETERDGDDEPDKLEREDERCAVRQRDSIDCFLAGGETVEDVHVGVDILDVKLVVAIVFGRRLGAPGDWRVIGSLD